MEYRFSDKVQGLRPSAIRELFKLMVGKDIIALSGGNPAKEAFPVSELAEISNEILTTRPTEALQYSTSEGYGPLREQIGAYMRERYGVGGPEDEVLITSGAQQANDLAVKIFCNDGDAVACDEVCFIGSISSFRSNDQRAVGIETDESGMVPAALADAVRRDPTIRAVYLIPNFQNPTGLTMPLQRRRELYQTALDCGIMIIEDNPYGQLRFKGDDVPSIKSFDTEGIVCYSGSFSKVVAPGLRVGYMIANRRITERGTLLKQFSDVHTNVWAQMIIHDYYERYDTDAHIASVCDFYGEKCRCMCELIRQELPATIRCREPEGGMFVWCTDTTGSIDISRLVSRLVDEERVAIISGDSFMTNGGASHSFRLNFTVPTKDEIRQGVEAIGRVIGSM